MDGSSAPQTVAQAIEAATQQQQQQQQHHQQHHHQQHQQQQAQQAQHHLAHPSPPVHTPGGLDNLVCQWHACGERCDSAESLYDHVCERHVGRKSTNNLNLTCAWGQCHTTTVKRDHITSHIRVHVPLKPHKCDLCGKSFKRPQDLKKHVKTHADDSVLINSPQPSHARAPGPGQNPKTDASSLNIAEAIQAYMNAPRSAAAGYYPGHDGHIAHNNPYPAFQPNMAPGSGPDNYVQQPAPYSGYGSVSYPNNANSTQDLQSMDTRRRAIEALNEFLGDIKRRALNPNTYYDVGQRLQSSSLPLPIATGNGYTVGFGNSAPSHHNSAAANNNTTTNQAAYNPGFGNGAFMDVFGQNGMGSASASASGGLHGPLAQPGYSLPMGNARTKNDLQEIDRFLEQLQATVYESTHAAAASGVQQPGVHSHFAADMGFGGGVHQNQYRSSHSPTIAQHSTGMGNGSGLNVSAPALDTPALTPASVSSYSSSGQSPLSSNGRPSMGGNAMYPSLPSVTGISDMGSAFPTTSSAPASGLASSFDELDGRRYSGGRLQRQAPGASTQDDMDMADDDGSTTPRQANAKPHKSKANNSSSSIDPALRDAADADSPPPSANGPSSSLDGDEKRQEDWVENIRVIEALRKWVGDRLKSGEYETSSPGASAGDNHVDEHDPAGGPMNVDHQLKDENDIDVDVDAKAVRTAKMVEEQMADALSRATHADDGLQKIDGHIHYPSLPDA